MIHHYYDNVTITSSEIVDSVIKILANNFVYDYNLLSLKVSIDYTLAGDINNLPYSYLPIPLNLLTDTTYHLKLEPPADPPDAYNYFTIYTEKEFTNQIEFTENDLANSETFVLKLHNKYYEPQEVIFSAVADTLDVVCCPEQPAYQTTDFVKQVDFTFNSQPFTLIAKAQPTSIYSNQLMLFYLSCDNFRVGQWEHSASLEITYTDFLTNLIDITVTAKFYVWDWQELIDDPVYYNKAYFEYKLETQINDFELSVTLDFELATSYAQIFGAGEPPATLAIVFSGQMQFPETLRIVLEDAFFPTGSIYTELYDDSEPSEIQLGNIDELLTYDPNLNSYVSDVLTLYGIEGRFIVDTILQESYAWNTVLKKSSLIDDDVKRFLYPLASLNHKFLLHLSLIPSKLYLVYPAIPFLINYAKGSYMPFDIPATTVNHGLEVGDMIIDSRINFLYQIIGNDSVFLGFFNLSDTDGYGNPWPHRVTRVKFASIKSLRKPNPFNRSFLNFEDDHDLIINPNTFYDSELIVTSNSLNSYFTTLVGSPSPLSVVTFNNDAIEDNAETLIIDGTDFYADNPFANIVVFNLGAEGFVSAATTTQLTVTFTTQPTSLGNLTAIIKNPFASGAAVQVATVVAGIVVTPNSDSRATNAPTLVIAGTGFSATANQNTVTFNLGAVGTVTSATTTELTVTFSTQPTSTGSLTAVVAVSTSNGDSGTAVEVATIVAAPTVSLNAAYFPIDDLELIISGTGFDAGTPANNLVTFNHGAVGTVTAATTTQLTVSMDTQPNQTGNFTASVNSFGGDSNTEIVGNAIDYLLSLGTVESYLTPYTIGWEVDSSGHGTQNNPFNVVASGENGDFQNEPADALKIRLVITYESGATLNWSGTWTDRGNAEMIWQSEDRMTNPVPPPAYVYFDDFVFVEYNHVGDGDSFTGSGSSAVTLPYSVGGGTYTAEFYLLIARVNTGQTIPSIDVNLWVTY